MKIIAPNPSIFFPFKKYCLFILEVVPQNDITGIERIQFVERLSHPKLNKHSVACYFEQKKGLKGIIEINFGSLLNWNLVPKHLFIFHQEIAAFFLSKIIYHEIGHHVHKFKRNEINKNEGESFADSYARAGYFNYFKSRENEILSTYTRASKNMILHDEPTREIFKKGHTELTEWLGKNKNGISFP